MKKFTILLFVLLSSTITAVAANWNFYAMCESGQTLYYKIDTDSTVTITYPAYFSSTSDTFYEGYTRPTGHLVIPSTVTHNGNTYDVVAISDYAFCRCSGLESVSFVADSKLTKIGMSAFYYCQLAQDLFLPPSLKSIGEQAFCNNYIRSVTISENVTHIGGGVFWLNSSLRTINLNARNLQTMGTTQSPGFVNGVPNLTVINIGANVTNIPAYAFSFTKSISDINCEAITPPRIYTNTFNGLESNIRVRVPCEAVDAYKSDGLWGVFTDIKPNADCSPTKITITILSNDLMMGVVTGSGKYDYATQVTAEAFANSGYKFSHWSNGSKYNPYRFAAIENMELTAIFVPESGTGLEDIEAQLMPFRVIENTLNIHPDVEGDVVIYTMDARVLHHCTTAANSVITLQPHMIYVVQLNGTRYKVSL
jgi:hypothetical protein